MSDIKPLPEAPAPTVEWHAFDYANKKATAPSSDLHYAMLGIVERFYTEGVTLGYFDGFTFRTYNGSDDCSVSHWAEIDYPEPPEGWDEQDDDDD